MIGQYSRREFERGTPRRRRTGTDARETLIRIVLPALLLYSAACLASARRTLSAAEARESSLRDALETVERDNRVQSRRLASGWSTEELEALARERLGLVLPGDRIFRFEEKS